jgi:hypothetical protein
MKLAFVCTPSSMPQAADATEWHKAMPRAVRKTLRLHTPKTASINTHDGVDSYMGLQYRKHDYFNQNLMTMSADYGHDEFGDIDDELDGLTIVETSSEAELFSFCTGYDSL